MPNALSEAQIIAAAKKFIEENDRTPTYGELREALGNVGSMQTIVKHYKPYRNEKDSELIKHNTAGKALVTKFPPPIALLNAIKEGWESALGRVAIDVTLENEAVQSMLRNDNNKLREEISNMEIIIEDFGVRYDELKVKYDESTDVIRSTQSELMQRGNDLAVCSGRIAELEKQVASTEQTLVHERKRLEEALAESASISAKYEYTIREHTKLSQELDKLSNKAA